MSGAPPRPVPDAHSAEFWAAAARGELVIARCRRCRQFSHPPDVVCPRCHDPEPDFHFVAVSGRGSVRSWVTIRQSFLPGFDVPYMLVDVALEEDPEVRLIGRLVNGPDATPALGDRVHVVFDTPADDVAVPAFALDPVS